MMSLIVTKVALECKQKLLLLLLRLCQSKLISKRACRLSCSTNDGVVSMYLTIVMWVHCLLQAANGSDCNMRAQELFVLSSIPPMIRACELQNRSHERLQQ